MIAPQADSRSSADVERRWSIVTCPHCGLTRTDPCPTDVELSSAYGADYKPHRAPLAPRCRQPRVDRDHPPPFGTGNLLDVGCGAGDYLQRMRLLGWNVRGVDASLQAARTASQSGLSVVIGDFPRVSPRNTPFDYITFWESLEHLRAPLAALQKARALLRPSGRIVISVPNFAGWAARRFGAEWIGLDLPRHLTHFTPRTLRQMVEAAGLMVVDLDTVRHSSWVRASANLAGQRLLRTKLGSRLACQVGQWLGQGESLRLVAARLECNGPTATQSMSRSSG